MKPKQHDGSLCPTPSRRPSGRPASAHRLRRHPLAAGLSLALTGGVSALGMLGLPATAAAQTASTEARAYAIPAGPLMTVLERFAIDAGIFLSGSAELTQGRNSPGLSGRYTVSEGFDRLLRDHGLSADRDGNGTWRLAPRPASAPAASTGPTSATGAMPPVRITGRRATEELTDGTGSYARHTSDAATGMNLPLQQTPQSISVLTRQRLDDSALDTLGTAIAQTTGATMTQAGGSIGSYAPLYSRGFTINSFMVDGVLTSPNTWGDGQRAGVTSVDTAIYDSVTLIRGATGLMTGAGDPGGTISLTRKRPSETFEANVSQRVGTWDRSRTVVDVGGPLNESRSVRGRMVFALDRGGSWLPRYRDQRTVNYGVLEVDLPRATTLRLAIEHSREFATATSPYSGFGVSYTNGEVTPFGRRNNSATDWSRFDNRRTMATAALEHRINADTTLRLAVNQAWRTENQKYANPGGYEPEPDGFGDLMMRRWDKRARSTGFDARVQGSFQALGRGHEYAVGINGTDTRERSPYSFIDRAYEQVQIMGWTGDYPEPDWNSLEHATYRARTRQYGAFASTRLRPTEALSIIAGARLSSWHYIQHDGLSGDLLDESRERNVLTPYFALVHDFTPNFTGYASYTSIFNPQSYRDVSGRVLDPEQGKNYEVGLKTRLADGRALGSIALFQVNKDNLAIEVPDSFTPTGEPAYASADRTRARGWEVEVSGQLARGWNVQAGYTRVVTRSAEGAPIRTYLPDQSARMFMTYSPASLARLTVGGGAVWQSRTFDEWSEGQMRDNYTQKSYLVVNLLARFAFSDRLSLGVNLNNLFDRAYRTDLTAHAYGPPRHLMATLQARL